MGSDLLSACVFCAGLLLSRDLPGPAGVSAVMGFSSSTLGRRYTGEPGVDSSEVTGRFVFLGIGMARPASDGLGAGTPEWEWRVMAGLGPADDDQTQEGSAPAARTEGKGRGRYENVALLYRHPLGKQDSIEVAWTHRSHKDTSVVMEGPGFREQRTLVAETSELALGWRHRWPQLEVSLSGGYVQPYGSTGTTGAFMLSDGTLWSGTLEGRATRGALTFLVSVRRASGSLDVGEQSAPAFAERNFSASSSVQTYKVGAGLSGKRAEAFLSATYDRWRLPFISLAVLGAEVAAYEQGFHPDSTTREFRADLTVRYAASRNFRPRLFLRWGRGDESVTLTDSAGLVRTRSLQVRRAFGKSFGDATIGLGAEVTVWSGH